MIDVNEILAEEIRAVSCQSHFFHIPENVTFPCISYYTVNDSPTFSTDNVAGFQRSHVSVDVWTTTPAESGRIAAEVINVLTECGWGYENMRDIAPESGVYHKVLRFVRDFEID